jgi:two-component system response regulator FixJ
MTNPTRSKIVFLVDDEPAVAKAVSLTLQELPCRVTCFTNASDCLNALTTQDCDLLITDVNMPGINGIELLKQAKILRPLLPVLVITGFGEIPAAVQAVKAGALDYLEKPLDEATFLPIVDNALKLHETKENKLNQLLTKTERKILKFVVEGKGNKEIAQLLNCSVRTIENHRYRMTRKLNVDSTASLVRTAIAMGFVSTEVEKNI